MMTDTQFNDLKAIANLAYGSGWTEGKSGGEGYVGMMRGPDGEARVFKCLTHRGERKGFESSATHEAASRQLADAGAELKLELRRLARAAGLDEATLDKIYDDDGNKPLLSRKIVAKVVTAIGKANKGADVWDGVKGAGTVGDTTISLVDGDEIDLEKYEDKGYRTMQEQVLQAKNGKHEEVARDAAENMENGYLDGAWEQEIRSVANAIGNTLPDVSSNGFDQLSFGIVIEKPMDVPLARVGFREPSEREQGDLYATFFKRELIKALKAAGDAPLTVDFRHETVEAAFRMAVKEAWLVTQLLKIAEAKNNGVKQLLEEILFGDDKETTDAAFNKLQKGLGKCATANNYNKALKEAWEDLKSMIEDQHAKHNKGHRGDFNMLEVLESRQATLKTYRNPVYLEDFYMK